MARVWYLETGYDPSGVSDLSWERNVAHGKLDNKFDGYF